MNIFASGGADGVPNSSLRWFAADGLPTAAETRAFEASEWIRKTTLIIVAVNLARKWHFGTIAIARC